MQQGLFYMILKLHNDDNRVGLFLLLYGAVPLGYSSELITLDETLKLKKNGNKMK